jgi:hypothetical protein
MSDVYKEKYNIRLIICMNVLIVIIYMEMKEPYTIWLYCQTSRSHYGSKTPAVTITVFKYRNKIGKIVAKTVPYSVNVNVKNTFTSHIDKNI